jgi:hypothetical protein
MRELTLKTTFCIEGASAAHYGGRVAAPSQRVGEAAASKKPDKRLEAWAAAGAAATMIRRQQFSVFHRCCAEI